MHHACARICITLALLATVVFGQDEQNQTAQTPVETPAPTPAPSAWTRKGIDFYLMGDVYVNGNFNNPATGGNGLYTFDFRSNMPHLNMAKFAMEKAGGVFGFRVDVMAGQAVDFVSAADPAPHGLKYLEQAFLEFRPNHMHGIQFDFGKFVSSAGAEVMETNANWNYSRSLLYSWATPFYHMGLRTTIPVNKSLTLGVQLVNGWNNVKDNNSGKTVGLVANYTWKKVTWSNDFYTGPEKDHTNKGFRNLYDTTVLVNPTDKLGIYVNFDYGSDKNIGNGAQTWAGIGFAGRYQLTKLMAFAPRVEYYSDKNGLTTGLPQNIVEATLTGEMKLREGVIARLEYRHDSSDHPFFNQAAGLPQTKTQDTVTLGLIAFFGPKK